MDKQQIIDILNKNGIKDDNLANALSEIAENILSTIPTDEEIYKSVNEQIEVENKTNFWKQ